MKHRLKSVSLLWLCFHGRFSFQFAPAHNGSVNGRSDRLDHHVIHHLAVTEALEKQPPEQAPALFALEQERKTGGAPVNGEKQRVIKKHLPQVRERKCRWLLQTIEQSRKQRVDQNQIHDR